MSDKLQILQTKVGELIARCNDFSIQNKKLLAERNKLLEKNSVVHTKVQDMIKDIRTIEGQR